MINQQATSDDYYKILECDPQANPQTIDFLFRFLIKLAETGASTEIKEDRVSVLTQAHDILSDPNKRAVYDQQRELAAIERQHESDSFTRQDGSTQQPSSAGLERSDPQQDQRNRMKILQSLLRRRRNDASNPGFAPSSIAQHTGLSDEETVFQLWYLTQKGWAQREESGVVSITAAGVDQCAETILI